MNTLDTVITEVNDLKERVDALEVGLSENTRLTKSTNEKTQEMYEAFSALSGGFKVIEFLGKLAKPLLWVVGLSALTTAAMKKFFPGFWS